MRFIVWQQSEFQVNRCHSNNNNDNGAFIASLTHIAYVCVRRSHNSHVVAACLTAIRCKWRVERHFLAKKLPSKSSQRKICLFSVDSRIVRERARRAHRQTTHFSTQNVHIIHFGVFKYAVVSMWALCLRSIRAGYVSGYTFELRLYRWPCLGAVLGAMITRRKQFGYLNWCFAWQLRVYRL